MSVALALFINRFTWPTIAWSFSSTALPEIVMTLFNLASFNGSKDNVVANLETLNVATSVEPI